MGGIRGPASKKYKMNKQSVRLSNGKKKGPWKSRLSAGGRNELRIWAKNESLNSEGLRASWARKKKGVG